MYKEYVTECLRVTAECAVRLCGGECSIKRFPEILYPRKCETRSVQEITSEIAERAGLVVKK